MKKLVAQLRVIFTAAPTYLVTIAVVVAILADEITPQLPTGWQDNAFGITTKILAILGAAISIIRRVTPVLPAQRGILPPAK